MFVVFKFGFWFNTVRHGNSISARQDVATGSSCDPNKTEIGPRINTVCGINNQEINFEAATKEHSKSYKCVFLINSFLSIENHERAFQ